MSTESEPQHQSLPIHKLHETVTFKAPKRLLFRFTRAFFTVFFLGLVMALVLVGLPLFLVPKGAEFQRARRYLIDSRVLTRHVGRPLSIAQSPEWFRRKGSSWEFSIRVHGPFQDHLARVVVDSAEAGLVVSKGQLEGWDLKSGRRILKKP